MSLGAGDRVLLAGSNGSGKTTLLRILSTTMRPSTGRVAWDPQEVLGSPEAVRRRIGYAGHQPLVYDELTVRENLRFAVDVHRVSEGPEAVQQWLERFGIQRQADDRAGTLSRGLRQRLALARAFVTRPRLLLLDEPAAALDAQASGSLMKVLQELDPTTCAVVATHETGTLAAWANRRFSLRAARLETDST